MLTKEKIHRVFTHIPQISTPRLLLRKMMIADTKDMYEYAAEPLTSAYLLWSPHRTPEYTGEYLTYLQSCYKTGTFYDWAVVCREQKKMIGTCGFNQFDCTNNSAEIGYVINPRFWGCGYATEAVGAVLQFGFETLGLHRIQARYMAENSASRRVMEKCGMHFEGILKGSCLAKGYYRDVGICAIEREAFLRCGGLR